MLQDDGTWMSVAPRPGSLVINVGDLLSRMTKGNFKARNIGKECYSIPFFLEPRSDMPNLNSQAPVSLQMDHGWFKD